MKWKERMAPYFTLSRKERTGVIIIGMIILALFGLPSLLPTPVPPSPGQADTAWIIAMKRLEEKGVAEKNGDQAEKREYNRSSYSNNSASPGKATTVTLFPFDPNHLDGAGWASLGLREKTIKTILNYLSKGGQFRKPEDLQRIYGLFPDEYERLRPYIRIPDEKQETKASTGEEKKVNGKTSGNYVTKKWVPVDINTADTSALIALPGIGSKLAQRIIHFREKLGGFYSISQVAETFGLADSVYRKIEPWLRLEKTALRKININTATAEELKTHPYLKWSVVNALIAFRKEHGPFRKKEELKQIMAVTEELYHRVAPYLVTE